MNRIEEIPAFDSRFPERLREIPESPGCIYLKGRLPDPVEMTVGIIGARDGTEYGKMVARTLAKELSEYGISIISGMAYGIDTAAHEGALLGGGKTYAVLGCGVDICYPAINKKIYSKIQEEGGIISEYPEGSPPLPHHFVARNRLIAGLSDILIVVEAKERSGTFITVDRALEQGKQVFVVPGRITDPLSRGCNKLLMEGASLCLSKEDILSCFSIEAGKDNEKKPNLKGEEKRIYNALDLEGKHIDALYKELEIPLQSLYSVLVKMEIEGYCECFSSSYYRKKRF